MERPLIHIDPLKVFFNNFMEGYEIENHLDELFIKSMDIFINYRRMLLFTVLQDWLDTNPETKKFWKSMIIESPAIMGRVE
jgi:amicoumacin kinase